MFALNSPAIHSAMLLFTCSFTLANPILGGRGTTTVSHFKGSPGLPKASPGTPQISFMHFSPICYRCNLLHTDKFPARFLHSYAIGVIYCTPISFKTPQISFTTPEPGRGGCCGSRSGVQPPQYSEILCNNYIILLQYNACVPSAVRPSVLL